MSSNPHGLHGAVVEISHGIQELTAVVIHHHQRLGLSVVLWLRALVFVDSLCQGERGACHSFGPNLVVYLLQVEKGH